MLGALSSATSSLFGGSSSSTDHTRSLQKEIRIKHIFVHPIKSCRGCAVPEASFDRSGIRFDRTWLIIDAQTKRFCTARELPKMVTITPRIDASRNELIIEVPLEERDGRSATIRTPLEPTEEQLRSYELVEDITIWVHQVNGYAVSKQADEALSTFFGKPVRLVRKGPSVRPSGPDDPRGASSSVRYQDFYPLLLASTASLRDVQKVLVNSVHPTGAKDETAYRVPPSVRRDYWTPEQLEHLEIERFRPNIVVDGGAALDPWEEDGWNHVEVFKPEDVASAQGGLGFGKELEGRGTGIDVVARCGRCMVPNVDPETGTRDMHLPYMVMQRFRQVQPEIKATGKPCFGMLSVPTHEGVIRVGDIVRVTSTQDPSKRTVTVADKKPPAPDGAGNNAAAGDASGGGSTKGGSGKGAPSSHPFGAPDGPSYSTENGSSAGGTMRKVRSFRSLRRPSAQQASQHDAMLAPPRPPFMGRSGSSIASSGYSSHNASAASLGSSDTDESSQHPPSSSTTSASVKGADSITSLPPKSPSSKMGKLGSFGRRMLSRSSIAPTRSQSSSSSATTQSSPPMTPTTPSTPPRLPFGGSSKGLGYLDALPQLPELSASVLSHAPPPSSNTTQAGVRRGLPSFASPLTSSDTTASMASLTTSSSSSSLNTSSGLGLGMPVIPPNAATVSTARRNSSIERRGSVDPVEELAPGETDFLRAVLSLSFDDGDKASPTTSSMRPSETFTVPFTSPFSSTASPTSSRLSSLGSPISPRTVSRPGMPPRLTVAEARELEEQERAKAERFKYRRGLRPGLFGRTDSDSEEDDYGEEEDEVAGDKSLASAASSRDLASSAKLFPSSFHLKPTSVPSSGASSPAYSRRGSEGGRRSSCDSFHSARDDEDDDRNASVRARAAAAVPPTHGLSTGPKRALYTCTLLKVHPQLADCFTTRPGGSELVPGASAIASTSTDALGTDLPFPRSMNSASRLENHPSTLNYARNLRVAVARTTVMRRLRGGPLSIQQEVELSWFQRKYGSELIAPDVIAARLAQRPSASPEALAKSPLQAAGTTPGSTARYTGIAAWARRPTFSQRCSETSAEEADLVDSLPPGGIVAPGRTLPAAVPPADLELSPRIRSLAGLPLVVRRSPTPAKFRPREGHDAKAGSSASSLGRGRSKKAPPPWIAPRAPARQSTLLVPGQAGALRRSASYASVSPPESERSPSQPSSPQLDKQASPQFLSPTSPPAMNRSASQGSLKPSLAPPRAARRHATFNGTETLHEDNEDGSDEEELPLAVIQNLRREREREAEAHAEARRKRDEERKRYEAHRLAQAREAERALQMQKQALKEARERRKHTQHSAVLQSHTYGAGDPTADSKRTTVSAKRQSSLPPGAGGTAPIPRSPSFAPHGAAAPLVSLAPSPTSASLAVPGAAPQLHSRPSSHRLSSMPSQHLAPSASHPRLSAMMMAPPAAAYPMAAQPIHPAYAPQPVMLMRSPSMASVATPYGMMPVAAGMSHSRSSHKVSASPSMHALPRSGGVARHHTSGPARHPAPLVQIDTTGIPSSASRAHNAWV